MQISSHLDYPCRYVRLYKHGVRLYASGRRLLQQIHAISQEIGIIFVINSSLDRLETNGSR